MSEKRESEGVRASAAIAAALVWLALVAAGALLVIRGSAGTVIYADKPSFSLGHVDGRPVEIYYTRGGAILRDGGTRVRLEPMLDTERLVFASGEVRVEVEGRRDDPSLVDRRARAD